MKKFAAILFCLSFLSNVSAAVTKYDPEMFLQGDTITSRLIEAKVQTLKNLNIKRVAVVECYGDFVPPQDVKIAARNKKNWENREINWAPNWTQVSKLDPTDDYYAFLVDRFYDLVRKIFEDNGIAVVVKENIGNDDVYSKLALADELNYAEEEFAGSKIYRRSATGLRVFSPQVQIPLLAQLTASHKCDAAVRASFFADLSQGQPLIKSFTVTMDSGVAKDSGKFCFKSCNEQVFVLKEPIISGMNLLGSDKKVDIKRYDSAIFEILTSISVLFNNKIQTAM